MRVELNQGTYRIRPNAPQGNPHPVNPVTPVKNVPSKTGVTPPTATGLTTIQRGPDVAQLTSLNLKAAQQNLPQIDKYHAKMNPVVAGKTNRPMSFDAAPPTQAMNIYDRAYFRHTADHASINAAAVERRQIDLRG